MIYPQQASGAGAGAGGSAGKRGAARAAAEKKVVRKKGGGGSSKQEVVQWKQKNVKEGLVIVDEQQLSKLIKREPIEKFYKLDPEPFATGLFATVRRCVSRDTGSSFAAKFSSRARYGEDCSAEIHHEIALLSLCAPSLRIVRLHDVFETAKEIIIVMEFAPGGDLQTVIDDNLVPFEADVVHFVHQLVEGLAYLHERKIAHLDIKPQNLVMMGDFPNCAVKLCDFEISRVILDGTEIREILGTPDYVAPEILHYEPITMAADMWSLGVTTYVLLTGFTPFGGESDQETFCNISRAQLEFPQELFEDVSEDAQDFIRKLLVREPSGRPNAKQLMRHRWLANRNAPKPPTKAPLPDTTTRSTMSQKNLRKYLSKSREALFERVVQQQQQHRDNSDLRKSTLVSQSYNKTRLCESHMSLVSRSRQDHSLNYLSPSFSRSREKLYGLRSLSKSHEGLDLLKISGPAPQGEMPPQGSSRKYTKSTTADLSMLPLLRLQEVESSTESLDGGVKKELENNAPHKDDIGKEKEADEVKESTTIVDEDENMVKDGSDLNGNAPREDDLDIESTKLREKTYGEETIKACVVLKSSGRQNVDDKAPMASTRHLENTNDALRFASLLDKSPTERTTQNQDTLDFGTQNQNNKEGISKDSTLLKIMPNETVIVCDTTLEDSTLILTNEKQACKVSSIINKNNKNWDECPRQKTCNTNEATPAPSLLSPQLLINTIESRTKTIGGELSEEVVLKPKDISKLSSLFESPKVGSNSSADKRLWSKPEEKENERATSRPSVIDSSKDLNVDDVGREIMSNTAETFTATPSTNVTPATPETQDQKSDEDEPKFSVAQLISAYNRHQDIVTKTSLAVTMTANEKDQKIPPLIVEDPTTKFPTGPKALRLFIPDIDIEPSKKTTRRNRTKSYRSLSRSSTQEILEEKQLLQEDSSKEAKTNGASENGDITNNIADNVQMYNICNFVVRPPGNVVNQKPPSNPGDILKRSENVTSYLRSSSMSSETSATSGCFTSESSGSASWEEVVAKKEDAQWIQKSGGKIVGKNEEHSWEATSWDENCGNGKKEESQWTGKKMVGKSEENPWGRLCTGTYNRAMEKFGGKEASPRTAEEKTCQTEKPARKCSLSMLAPTNEDLEEKTRRKSTSTMQHS